MTLQFSTKSLVLNKERGRLLGMLFGTEDSDIDSQTLFSP
jgi:hypothetical protein